MRFGIPVKCAFTPVLFLKEQKYIKSPINYVGNKYKLIEQMIGLFPEKIKTFVDVFGGSGTVLINVRARSISTMI